MSWQRRKETAEYRLLNWGWLPWNWKVVQRYARRHGW